MFSSLKLGKFFGIDLYVHATFWLLPLFVFFSGAMSGDLTGAALDVAMIFAVFGCVVLHEVGHALAAAYYGIRTRHITLYPIGGVAALERMPERPLHEIVVALAGPAVNLAIALGLLGGIVLGNVALPGSLSVAGLSLLDQFVLQLLFANVFLLVFNLLPAFPMDGGRVLRAMLNIVMPRTDATQVAVVVGSVLEAGHFLYGRYSGNSGLVLVAAVVFFLGRAERAQVRAIEARREWERRNGTGDFEGPEPEVAEVISPPRFTGWVWDPGRRIWSEWRDGVLIREIPAV